MDCSTYGSLPRAHSSFKLPAMESRRGRKRSPIKIRATRSRRRRSETAGRPETQSAYATPACLPRAPPLPACLPASLAAEGGTLAARGVGGCCNLQSAGATRGVDENTTNNIRGKRQEALFRIFGESQAVFSPPPQTHTGNDSARTRAEMKNPLYWALLVGMSVLLMEQGERCISISHVWLWGLSLLSRSDALCCRSSLAVSLLFFSASVGLQRCLLI